MTNQPADWLTIREASLSLGVSELTIRRRIKDGRLSHRLVQGKYFVTVDDDIAALSIPRSTKNQTPTAKRASGGQSGGPVSFGSDSGREGARRVKPRTNGGDETTNSLDLLELVAEHTRLAEVAGRARLLEEQLHNLERRHAELQDGAIVLATRNGWLESRLEEREHALKLLTDSQRKRPWWKRMFTSHDKEA